jgi:hypothetical protein
MFIGPIPKINQLRTSAMYISLLRSFDHFLIAGCPYFTDAIPSITTRATVGIISRSLA